MFLIRSISEVYSALAYAFYKDVKILILFEYSLSTFLLNICNISPDVDEDRIPLKRNVSNDH